VYLEGPSPLPRTCPVRNQPLGRGFLWPDVKIAKLSTSATGTAPVPEAISRMVELGAKGEEIIRT
jgi:hypothetical protein